MSAYTAAQLFVEQEVQHKSRVMHSTWGHLAPEPRTKHPGHIVFCFGEYGDITPIRCHFDGLNDSPWFFDAMTDYIADKATDRGKVYRFDGTVMMCKNGKFKFSGKVRTLRI